jgi:hypothetical protein
VTAAPDTLTLKTHRDQEGRRGLIWVRRAFLALLTLLLLAAVLNAFGQRPETTTAAVSAAKLSVYAPERARSGVIYAARFRIDARAEIRNARLVLWPGWAEQYTVNGQTPQPVEQASDNGKLSFTFGHVPAGRHLTFWLSLQVNPTNVGSRPQKVQLYDDETLLLTVNRDITVFP